jgi:iron(III) transport system substrate-binding protein
VLFRISAIVVFGFASGLSSALSPAAAEPPPPAAITPELIAAAKQEGAVVWYTSIELQTAEKLAKSFEAAYPGIKVQVERNGAERNFQRIAQERGSNIHAVDAAEASDMGSFIQWKREGWLAPFVPKDVGEKWPAEQRDPDGCYATVRFNLSPIVYNTRLVKAEDAPKSFADLLDPKWKGKLVKAHPGYSGTIMTVTFEMVRDLGWDYLQKLGQQRVMQVQSGTEPPKKTAQGERPVMVDGGEYLVHQMIAAGAPLAIVYPSEGTPTIPGGTAVFADAPHPNAARLFVSYLLSREGQQVMSDNAWMRSFHPDVKPHDGVKPLGEIKVMKADPAGQVAMEAEIKKKYAEYFGL